jgi:hypothetical protein
MTLSLAEQTILGDIWVVESGHETSAPSPEMATTGAGSTSEPNDINLHCTCRICGAA